jgi:hypothetical protein
VTKASQFGASFAVKQLEHLGFVKVEVGPRRINVFMLIDEWNPSMRSKPPGGWLWHDPKPQRASSKPAWIKKKARFSGAFEVCQKDVQRPSTI